MTSVIPRKVREVAGPSSFSDATDASGTPRLKEICIKLSRFSWHSGEQGSYK